MRKLNWAARIYVLVVVVSTVVLWAISLLGSPGDAAAALGLETLIFLVATIGSEFLAVSMPGGGWLSISTIPHVALALLFPIPVAMAISAVAILVHQVSTREPWYKAAFNVANYAFAVGASAAVAALAGHSARNTLVQDDWQHWVVLMCAAAVYYILNNLLTYVVVALAESRSLRSVVVGNERYMTLPELGMVAAGELLAVLWVSRPLWSLAIIFTAIITHRTLSYMRRLQTETEDALVALADIVDDRDAYTSRHSRRVAAYAGVIAAELGLDASEVDVIVSAARVHDVGKIGVPDSILLKPGVLTPEEKTKMSSHAAAGADILARFHLFQDGMKLARHHHERHDGLGYPDGLVGEEIPLGARILAVADAFDAMTTDRPYRRALRQSEAVERLKAGQGSQFDPAVVAAFVDLVARGEVPDIIPSAAPPGLAVRG